MRTLILVLLCLPGCFSWATQSKDNKAFVCRSEESPYFRSVNGTYCADFRSRLGWSRILPGKLGFQDAIQVCSGKIPLQGAEQWLGTYGGWRVPAIGELLEAMGSEESIDPREYFHVSSMIDFLWLFTSTNSKIGILFIPATGEIFLDAMKDRNLKQAFVCVFNFPDIDKDGVPDEIDACIEPKYVKAPNDRLETRGDRAGCFTHQKTDIEKREQLRRETEAHRVAPVASLKVGKYRGVSSGTIAEIEQQAPEETLLWLNTLDNPGPTVVKGIYHVFYYHLGNNIRATSCTANSLYRHGQVKQSSALDWVDRNSSLGAYADSTFSLEIVLEGLEISELFIPVK